MNYDLVVVLQFCCCWLFGLSKDSVEEAVGVDFGAVDVVVRQDFGVSIAVGIL